MTNYNKFDQEYSWYLHRANTSKKEILPGKTLLYIHRIRETIAETAKDESNHEYLCAYNGVLQHLEGFLLCSERIVSLLENLTRMMTNLEKRQFPMVIVKRSKHSEGITEPPFLLGISSTLIELETEMFLLRAVALLDNLYTLIAKECCLQGKGYYSILEEELLKNKDADLRCYELVQTITDIKPRLAGKLISDGKKKTLRNVIAHRSAMSDLLDYSFSINAISTDQILAFDADVGGYPLMGTIRDLTGAIPQLVVSILRILLKNTKTSVPLQRWAEEESITDNSFIPPWHNPFINYNSYVTEDGNGTEVSVIRWLAGGFQPYQLVLKKEVFNDSLSLESFVKFPWC